MGIEQVAALAGSSAVRAPRRTGRASGCFVVPEGADETVEVQDSGPAEAPSKAATVGCVDLQAAAPRQDEADLVAAGQGRALLGALAGLQLAELGGAGVQARATLADLARAMPQAADPKLDAVLRAIAQRAAIELARAG